MSVRTVAIAQPTFLPWAGWFDLADQVDLLVILDDVAFSKQSWQQRNRLRSRNGLDYFSVPVRSAGRLGQRIVDTHTVGPQFAEKLIRTLAADYSRAPFYAQYIGEFCEVLRASASSCSLAELNIGIIDWLAIQLGVETLRVRSSAMALQGKRGEYVARLCEYVGATRYLSPAGAEEYLLDDQAEFASRSISIGLQVYEHPEYPQCFKPFLPYASVLDLLLNTGAAAGGIMRSGRRPARALNTPDGR